MRTLYIECRMGAAGDMLTAALSELLSDKAAFFKELNEIMPDNVKVSTEIVSRKGVEGASVSVLVNGEEEHSHDVHHHQHEHEHSHEQTHKHIHDHHHEHHSIQDIEQIVSGMNISDKVKKDVMAVYNLIAGAESKVHGKPVEEIHFHEVGALDAVADICAVCMLIERLAPEKIICSPINVGHGHVHCAHGILPVPAPATALLLEGLPIYSCSVEGELCTPTGAALLRYFADEFSGMPIMRTQKIGVGMGKKEFERLNCVRVFSGETENDNEEICELKCSVDDITGEEMSYAISKLISSGALDAYCTPIVMKKGRPAFELTCLCKISDTESLLPVIFQNTTTLGVRRLHCERYTLNRRTEKVPTKFGAVAVKFSEGYGVKRSKAEFDDAVKAAESYGVSPSEVKREAEKHKG